MTSQSHPTNSPRVVLRLLSLCAGCLLSLYILPKEAHALSIRTPTFAELSAQADFVVQVTTLSNTPELSPGKLPMLRTRFQISRELKGSAPRPLQIRLLHAQSQRFRLHLTGIPRFQVGAQAILFLRRSSVQGFPILVALVYGVFDLLKDPEDKEWKVKSRGHLLPTQPIKQFIERFEQAQKTTQTLSTMRLLQKKKQNLQSPSAFNRKQKSALPRRRPPSGATKSRTKTRSRTSQEK